MALLISVEAFMTNSINLRPASLEDARLLLEWRNDMGTRKASRNPSGVDWEEHESWLRKSLRNTGRMILIAEECDIAVGTVRADLSDGIWELSWTVAPNARGRGVAKRMVAIFARKFPGPLRAEIKAGNIASVRVAEHIGMTLDKEKDGILHYIRPALTNSNAK